MKTIAVSENAYTRLASWKTDKNDTFSAVIERLVPPKGTMTSALTAAEKLPDLSKRDFESLDRAVSATRRKLVSTWK